MIQSIIFATIGATIAGAQNVFIPGHLSERLSRNTFILYRESISTIFLVLIAAYDWIANGHAFTWRPIAFLFVTISGVSGYYMFGQFYKGLKLGKKGPVSAVVYAYAAPVALIGVVFALTGFTFLGEYVLLPGKAYLAIAAIVGGIILLSLFTNGDKGGEKDHKESMKAALKALGLYVIMLLFFGPVPGMIGASFAAFVARLPIALCALADKRRHPEQFTTLPKNKIWVVILFGLLMTAVMWFLSKAFQLGDKGIVAAIYGINPLVTWIGSLIRDKEERHVNTWQVIGILLAVGGVVTLSLLR